MLHLSDLNPSISLRLAQISLDDALLDSFNTPLAMTCLEDLISRSNQYLTAIARPPFSAQPSSLALLAEVARWLTRMITTFGLNPSGSTGGDPIGWSPAAASSASSASNAISDDLLPFARSVSTYRDSIRLLALTLPPEPKSQLLTLSDTLRDTSFLSLGLSLDDRAPGQPALLKQVPVAELLAARDRKIAEQAAAARKKESARLERERLEQQKAEKGKVDPREMFRTADWADWDDEGVPLREKDGTEVTQSKRKKLRKDWERQKKAHEAWLASASQTSTKPGTE